ncbi:aldo/keto reductase [bacterium]|nr:aldo/keto reductase [bacterium]
MVKIGLGTVQIGLPYGGNRSNSIMDITEAFSIFETAYELGIRFFDTAVIYGESEARIGQFVAENPRLKIEVSSKLPRVAPEVWSAEEKYREFVVKELEESLKRTRQEFYPLLQLHQCTVDFLASDAVSQVMHYILEQGYVKSIGVSVYEVEEAKAALECDWVSALQVPVNVIEQRFVSEELVQCYREHETRVIARSLFLQGVLIPGVPLQRGARSCELEALRADALRVAGDRDLPELTLGYIYQNLCDVLDIGLMGVQSSAELRENVTRIRTAVQPLSENDVQAFGALGSTACESRLLDPKTWA